MNFNRFRKIKRKVSQFSFNAFAAASLHCASPPAAAAADADADAAAAAAAAAAAPPPSFPPATSSSLPRDGWQCGGGVLSVWVVQFRAPPASALAALGSGTDGRRALMACGSFCVGTGSWGITVCIAIFKGRKNEKKSAQNFRKKAPAFLL